MIIVRSPMRIPLGGGGTDLPSYYHKHGGFLIAAAIDKYVYVALNRTFDEKIVLKYSKLETVQSAAEIQHPIVREALKMLGVNGHPHLEIASMSDIPAGTGMGSSGSFTTALLLAMHTLQNRSVTAHELAEQAFHVEHDLLGEPVGRQDQYVAAVGGVNCYTFSIGDSVSVEPLQVSTNTMVTLEDNLMLFFTGFSRSASEILRDQESRSIWNDEEMLRNLNVIKYYAQNSRKALEVGDLRAFADIMREHWEVKKRRSPGITNERIDECYRQAMCSGALGGKLIGAGGGGFLLLYTENRTRLRDAMSKMGLQEVRFRFDFRGSSVLVS